MTLTRPLRVLANPYAHLDHHGRPASPFPYEPDPIHGDTAVRFVGAKRIVKETKPARQIPGMPGRYTQAEHDYSYEFSTEPTLVENTDYYRRAIKGRDLIAADLESWELAGCDPVLYKDPRQFLAELKEGAQHQHRAHYGRSSEECAKHWDEFHAANAAALAKERADEAKKRAGGEQPPPRLPSGLSVQSSKGSE